MTDLTVRPLDSKQKLVLAFLEALDIEQQLEDLTKPLLKLPPFASDPEMSKVFFEKYRKAFLAERGAFAQAVEETYTEEELKVLVEVNNIPAWRAAQGKNALLAERMHSMLFRIYETLLGSSSP